MKPFSAMRSLHIRCWGVWQVYDSQANAIDIHGWLWRTRKKGGQTGDLFQHGRSIQNHRGGDARPRTGLCIRSESCKSNMFKLHDTAKTFLEVRSNDRKPRRHRT